MFCLENLSEDVAGQSECKECPFVLDFACAHMMTDLSNSTGFVCTNRLPTVLVITA